MSKKKQNVIAGGFVYIHVQTWRLVICFFFLVLLHIYICKELKDILHKQPDKTHWNHNGIKQRLPLV